MAIRLSLWLWIGAGGAAGAALRYAISGWVQSRSSGTFPWGTLAVNILGCFVMGVLAVLLFEKSILRPEYRTAILVGVLGAFTTWSSFGYETIRMLNDHDFRHAIIYVLATNIGCLSAVWLAYRMTERFLTSPTG